MDSTETFTILNEDERLDRLLAHRFCKSRSYFQHLITEKCVLVNGSPVKKRFIPRIGDEIKVCFQLTPELDLLPENIPLDILYEDEHLIAINKPAGMVTHPAPGHPTGTFANALVFHCKQKLEGGTDPLRPGIVHRLDKETSGVLIAAKTSQAHALLIEQFSKRQIDKTYLAITTSNPGICTVDSTIGSHPIHRKQMACVPEGRSALTHFQTLAQDGPYTLVLAKPHTGRTHQVRVHLKSLNCPIVGDTLYGSPAKNLNRHLLHAYELKLKHPITAQDLHFQAPVPKEFFCGQKFTGVLQSGARSINPSKD
ncbi:MAG: RluA family pseudouridine synthase [Chlamydiia bacterium]|nr:RluA family pseudouridine synthase [Chlamydiia bacterium]